MSTASPLGRFAAPAAALACLFVLAAAVLQRIVRGSGDQFLDYLAVAALGVLIGAPMGAAQGRAEGRAEGETAAVAKINGALAQGHAANARLDAIGAPSAATATVSAQAAAMPVPTPAAPLDPLVTPPPAPYVPADDRMRL